MRQNETILIVEDDTQIQNFIHYAVRQEGFHALTAKTAQGALSAVVSNNVDLMLLDLGLPDFDGMEVIAKVRGWSEMPIIVVSARDQDREKAAALDAGADDYLTKPFSTTELLARIRVALRHVYKTGKQEYQPSVSVGGITLNFEKRQVFLNGEMLHLSPLEYTLLALFFQNPGKVLTTQYIMRNLYGPNHGSDTQSLRTLMAGLRRKIEPVPAKPRYIITEIGVGYRLLDE